jgi:hypothetical protein
VASARFRGRRGIGEDAFMHGLRAIRGLILGLSISGVNLAGLFLTILVLGGLGEWTGSQFIGVFGIFEIATGIAFIFCPNAWRLPVLAVDSGSDERVTLAASTMFIPHWAGAAKSLAGLVMVVIVAIDTGVGWATAAILPFAFATAILVVAISVVAARFGVVRPDLDVIRFIIRRPRREDRELPGMSLTASTLQIVLGALTLPAIKVFEPAAFYQPEIGPSPDVLLGTTLAAIAATVVALLAWRGSLVVQAPAVEQREAEKPA